jgi:hypothetical protein
VTAEPLEVTSLKVLITLNSQYFTQQLVASPQIFRAESVTETNGIISRNYFTNYDVFSEDREWANSTPSGPSRTGSSAGRGGLGGRGDTLDLT